MKTNTCLSALAIVIGSMASLASGLEDSLNCFSAFVGVNRFPEEEVVIRIPDAQLSLGSNQWDVCFAASSTNDFRETIEVPFSFHFIGETNQIQGRLDWYSAQNRAVTGVFLERFLTPVPLQMELEKVSISTNGTDFCMWMEKPSAVADFGSTPSLHTACLLANNIFIEIKNTSGDGSLPFLLWLRERLLSTGESL